MKKAAKKGKKEIVKKNPSRTRERINQSKGKIAVAKSSISKGVEWSNN